MHFKVYMKYSITLILLISFVSVSFSMPEPADAHYSFGHAFRGLRAKIASMKKGIEVKRKVTRQKIYELKKREKVEVNKLYQSQSKLEATKSDIAVYQGQLNKSQNHLVSLHSQITSLTIEQQRSARLAGKRLKQIYEGERVSILHLIFAANSINTFLDRVYYQKRLAVYDKKLLNDLRAKTVTLMNAKQSVESEKNNILTTINAMNEKKRQIAASINTSQYLINKLKTDRSAYEASERDLARQSEALEAKLRASLSRPTFSFKGHIQAGFLRPTMGLLTSPFGWRRHPIFGSRSFHTGIDLATPYGTPIKASNAGTVIYTGWYGGYGKVVIINHGNIKGTNTSTLYAHMSATAVGSGSSVHKGQTVGYIGTTGYSTGPHVHFEVRLNGRPTNPLNFVH